MQQGGFFQKSLPVAFNKINSFVVPGKSDFIF